jgi:hypothetical protein
MEDWNYAQDVAECVCVACVTIVCIRSVGSIHSVEKVEFVERVLKRTGLLCMVAIISEWSVVRTKCSALEGIQEGRVVGSSNMVQLIRKRKVSWFPVNRRI